MTALLPVRPRVVPAEGAALRSALYEGKLRHRRLGPEATHEFSYDVSMPLIDLEEIGALARLHPLWSNHGPRPLWFRRADYLGDRDVPLERSVRDLVEIRSGVRPAGAVSVLTNVRTWGWLFNPISLYFCGDAGGGVASVVAEVENTPWHERTQYVVGSPGTHRFAKTMHVSPFLPMDVDYVLRYSEPTDRLGVRLDVVRGDERLLEVTLSLRRRPLDRMAIGRLLTSFPGPTHRVSTGIYAQALRLASKRAPFYAHPDRRQARLSASGRQLP